MQAPGMAPGQQMQQMQAPGQQMQQGMGAAGPTAYGVSLNPGERVVYAFKPSYMGDKIAYWFLGVLTAIFLIGIYFIYLALTIEKKNPRAHLVTTQRIITVQGEGEPLSYWLQNVADLEPVRQKVNAGGGGLLGAAISAGVSAVANKMADKNAKTTAKYWTRAIGIILIEHSGARQQVDCRDAKNMGLFLAQGMMSGGFNNAPDAAYEA
jgi:hypothetical protein